MVRFGGRYTGKEVPGWLLPFLVGFLVGVILMNTGMFLKVENSSLLDEYTLGRLKYLEINCNTFFIYVLQKRMAVLWLLMLFGITTIGLYVFCGYLAWCGFALGTLLSVAVMRYGIKGILLMVTGAFPHYIFYVPACLLLLKLGQRLYRKEQNILQCGMSFLGIHIVVIIGILLESYVNPYIMTKILKIF